MSDMPDMTEETVQPVTVEEDAFADADGTDDAPVEESDAAEESLRRIEELEARLQAAEAAMAKKERELSCMNLLSAARLPSELAGAVMASEDMAQTVELISGAVRSAVAEEMKLRCRSDAPEKGRGIGITREELLRLPVAELQSLLR